LGKLARSKACRPGRRQKGVQTMLKEAVAKDIEAMIRDYIAENILFSRNGYPHSDGTSFLEGGIVDSTNVLELVMFVEEKFSLTVEDQDITPDNFDSVSKLAAYVRRKSAMTV
jgi:acyl carrier protein